MGTLHIILLTTFCVGGILLLNVGFLFLLLGLLPTVVAYIVDETKPKDLYKTVRAANVAGMLPTLAPLTQGGHPGAALQVAMGDPGTWLLVYGSASAGWGLVWMCRWVSYVSVVAASQARILLCEKAQKELEAEWGEEIKEFVISTAPPTAA